MEILLYLGGVVFMLIGLGLSIGLHEVGHLLPAKLFGVRVGQYMIGFGPRLWSKRIGETEYGFKALPLGGFISMSGMYPPSSKSSPARGVFASLVQDARTANDETIGQRTNLHVYSHKVGRRTGGLLALGMDECQKSGRNLVSPGPASRAEA